MESGKRREADDSFRYIIKDTHSDTQGLLEARQIVAVQGPGSIKGPG